MHNEEHLSWFHIHLFQMDVLFKIHDKCDDFDLFLYKSFLKAIRHSWIVNCEKQHKESVFYVLGRFLIICAFYSVFWIHHPVTTKQ